MNLDFVISLGICNGLFSNFFRNFALQYETKMLDRLQIVKQRFDEISDLIIQPDVISDQKRYVQLNK